MKAITTKNKFLEWYFNGCPIEDSWDEEDDDTISCDELIEWSKKNPDDKITLNIEIADMLNNHQPIEITCMINDKEVLFFAQDMPPIVDWYWDSSR